MSNVDHPAHYGGDVPYEPIKLIVDWGLGFCGGNALKYILRAPHKGNEKEDLAKARWYLCKAVQIAEIQTPANWKLKPLEAIHYWNSEGSLQSTDLMSAVMEISEGRWFLALTRVEQHEDKAT